MTTNERTKVDINYNVLRFIYIEAMKDATRQRAFPYIKKWLWDDEDIISKLLDLLKEFLENVLGNEFKSQGDFDVKFLELCTSICDCINPDAIQHNSKDCFSFGNTQKLVNIFIKFFYILAYDKQDNLKRFELCHCPMDSIMLNKVKEECEKRAIVVDSKDLFSCSWSTIDIKDTSIYFKYQVLIRDLCQFYEVDDGGRIILPIEYDYYMWK